jgi:hypothetical protein
MALPSEPHHERGFEMETSTFNYRRHPALSAYIERVGAEEQNFRRFMVKLWHNHYYEERSLITVSDGGELVLTGKDKEEFEPTKEEREAIKRELEGVEFPKSAPVSEAQVRQLRGSGLVTGVLYEFWDRDRKSILMCQERREGDEAGKYYLPWSFWSDGKWRMMEPAGKLPLWKPRRTTGRRRLMVHEGAKTAEVVTRMVEEERGHPWLEFLSEYEHWGMIGGALAPQRTDYEEMRRFRPIECIYVCDNDQQGKDAVRVVSEKYGQSMSQISFDSGFPSGWDMADPLPRDMFIEGRYQGLTLDRLVRRATWATDGHAVGGKSKRVFYKIKRAFASEWVNSVKPDAFIHRQFPDNMLTSDQFNNWVRPFSDVRDTADLMLEEEACKSATLTYDPSRRSGVWFDKAGRGKLYINTHVGGGVVEERGGVEPFLEFMENLVSNEKDRTELIRWCATLSARPDIKMSYGVLLISETQGVGKTTLGDILMELVGEGNTSYPTEDDIVNSQFNSWASHKRLAIVNEIYQGHSSAAYNRLKDKITDSKITVKEKFQYNYVIDNWLHLFACSNDKRALKMTSDDRRWLVPRVTEKKLEALYWDRLRRWLETDNGLGKIKHWFREWVRRHGPVVKGKEAPWSDAKLEVIEEGYTLGQIMVRDYLQEASRRANGRRVVVTDIELLDMVKHFIYSGRSTDKMFERLIHVRKVAKSLGWFVGENQVICGDMEIPKNSRLISLDSETASLSGPLLREQREALRHLEPIPDCKGWKIVRDFM